MNIDFIFADNVVSKQINANLYDGEKVIGRCSISMEAGVWTISAWYVDKEYQNKGLGRKLLFDTCEEFQKIVGEPVEVQYNWNGTNKYVFDWLSDNFSPLSMCPISVMKYEEIYPEDIPEGHLYKLVKEQFVSYWKKYQEETSLSFQRLG